MTLIKIVKCNGQIGNGGILEEDIREVGTFFGDCTACPIVCTSPSHTQTLSRMLAECGGFRCTASLLQEVSRISR